MRQFPIRIITLILSALGAWAVNAAELESTTPVRAKTNGEAWWNGKYEGINNEIKKMEGEVDVAFVGDSITARWGGESWQKHWGAYRAVNMGIGGDSTQHVLWRLQNGQLDDYKAKVFVVMIGTNNLWGKTAKPEHAAAGVKAVLDQIQAKQPEAKILLMSLLPTGEKPNPGRDSRAAVNDIIKQYAGGSIAYIDVWDKFLEPDGMVSKEVMHDFLHLAPKGYDIWAEAISGKVKEIVEPYDARIADKQILTPVPPAAPRINGPVLYGARPEKQFIFRIPTQGERPIRFEVRGLPDSLKLDAEQGILTGVTPKQRGDYPMTFTAKNRHGESSRPFKLVVGDQYAKWGFDLLKYDQFSGGADLRRLKATVPGFQSKDFWAPMAFHLRDQNRDILFNLCQYGQDAPWTWAPQLGIQFWRTGGDLNHNLDTYFAQALRVATKLRDFNKPGQWNDPDFMYIHRIRDHERMGEPSVEIKLDTNQRYQYVTLWSIICAPFFFSCDVEHIDEFTLRALGNADVLNINQDELAHTAEVVRNDSKQETVMLKKLADGSKVLAVFNRDGQNEATIRVNWEEIGAGGEPEVFDVWRQTALGSYKNGISVRLSPNGVALFNIKQ